MVTRPEVREHRALPPPAERVVVTGLGVVSSIGLGAKEFAAALRAGIARVRPIGAFDTRGFDYAMACEVQDFAPEQWVRDLPLDSLGRASQFCVVAARQAVEDAGLAGCDLTSRRSLVCIGTTEGESRDLDHLVELDVAAPGARVDPVLAGRLPTSMLSASVAHELGLADTEAITVATACAAGNYAIGAGYDALRLGDVEIALCGGGDALCRRNFASFYRLGAVAPDLCRPFEKDRLGIITGEGAGVLVLETLESAHRRGARAYAEILGYGLTCDAHHPVAPKVDGVIRSMSLALRHARIEPHEVSLVSAHGTGTRSNDVVESTAVRRVFGDSTPPVVGMKSMLGHTMGASSALGAIGCAIALDEGFIPPTINHRQTDPECEVDCVPNVSVETPLEVVLNNGLAFGGNNASVVLGRHP